MTEQELLTEETTENPVEYISTVDYTEQLTRIEEALNSIDEHIETYGSVSFFESNGIGFISGQANTTDIVSLLLMIIIMLGLIFGALVFRHYRK